MYKWERRERKQQAERRRMKKSGRSLFVIVRVQVEKSRKIKREREARRG